MKTYYYRIAIIIFLNCFTLTAFSQYNNAFRIKITGNGYSDETIIRLLNGASQNFDGSYDAWKMFSPNPNVPSIYTQITNGQELSINSLPEFAKDTSITIYTNIPTNGSYTINFEEVYNLSSNYKISLSDISSNTHFRLLGDTALTFNFNTQQNSPSFTFNISTSSTSTASNESCFQMNDGSLLVSNPGNTDWNIEIKDASSNIVLNSPSNVSTTNLNNLAPGNYTGKVSSKGIVDEFNFTIAPAPILTANFELNKDTIYLSEGGEVNLTNNSQNAQNYDWDFNDGDYSTDQNPNHYYSGVGEYDISLTVNNLNCSSTSNRHITVLNAPSIVTSINQYDSDNFKLINQHNGNYQLLSANNLNNEISIYDINGKLILKDHIINSSYNFNLSNNASGIYIMNIISKNGKVYQQKFVN